MTRRAVEGFFIIGFAACVAALPAYYAAIAHGVFYALALVVAYGVVLFPFFPSSARHWYRWPGIVLIFAFLWVDVAFVYIVLALMWAFWRTTVLDSAPGEPAFMSKRTERAIRGAMA